MGRTEPQERPVSAKLVVSNIVISPPVFKMQTQKKSDVVYRAASVSPPKAIKKPKGKEMIQITPVKSKKVQSLSQQTQDTDIEEELIPKI